MGNDTQISDAQVSALLTAEPGVLERALHPFTVLGFVPLRLSLRRKRPDRLFVSARYAGIDIDRAINLAARIRAMPCAIGVRISVRRCGRVDQKLAVSDIPTGESTLSHAA